jgi:Amidohydrolase
MRHDIGIDHIMLEVDYPHPDSTWPDTQPLLRERFAGIPDEEIRAMCYENACRLFGHPEPSASFAAKSEIKVGS